jgi:hypothetical protein
MSASSAFKTATICASAYHDPSSSTPARLGLDLPRAFQAAYHAASLGAKKARALRIVKNGMLICRKNGDASRGTGSGGGICDECAARGQVALDGGYLVVREEPLRSLR